MSESIREAGPESTHNDLSNNRYLNNGDEKVDKEKMEPFSEGMNDSPRSNHQNEKLYLEKSPNLTDSSALEEGESTPDSGPLQPTPEHIYPEGGLNAWLVVFGAWCCMFASFGIVNSFAVVQAYISANQLSTYSSGAIGWIFGVYAFLTFVCGVYIGPLFDVYGPRWLIIPGSACLILSMFLLGVCHEYWHFMLAFGVVGGIGSALTFTPSVTVIGHYFNRGRGNATGIAATGGAFGGVVFPLMLQSLIPKIGWAWSTRIIGFIFIFLCGIAILLIKANLSPLHRATSPHPDFRIMKQPAFAVVVIAVFLIEWALFIPITYITSYATQEGFSRSFSYQVLPLINAGSIFGRWLPGFYSDIIGRFNTAILSLILTVILTFAIWLPFGGHTAGIVLFTVLLGFASGSNISLTPVCVGQLCETKDYGRYYATCYTIVSFATLTGVPIAGEILQKCGGEYWGLITFTGICYVGAFVTFLIARGLAGGWSIMTRY